MRLWTLIVLLILGAGLAGAATIQVYVYGSRDIQSVNYQWTGTKYNITTNYIYHVSVQIPRKPNGDYAGWERETNVVLATRPTWLQVSNQTVRLVRSELLAAGISTNHVIAVRRGGRQ